MAEKKLEERRETVGGDEAGFLFEFTESGVFLTIYPMVRGTRLFELSDMKQILQEHKVVQYDSEMLARALRESSGRAVQLATGSAFLAEEQENAETVYAKVLLDVSKDGLTVKAHYDRGVGELPPTKEMVLERLKEQQVVFGILEDKIDEGIASGAEFIVAEGKAPQQGTDARIERKFDLGVRGRPMKVSYDRVDYKNMNLFVIAHKGDILAEHIPQTEGVAGMNVYGREMPARKGKPIPIPQGKNTEIVGDSRLVATIDGQIRDTGKKIEVDPCLVLNNGVGVGTGNIDFIGGVQVKGDIEAGFSLKATGDIEINGLISGAKVEGNNITVKGGITGSPTGKVIAHGDLNAAFIQTADVEADGEICIADVILHSNVSAGKGIIVEEKRGMIVGGRVSAGEFIVAKIFGNASFVVTNLSVGMNPKLQEKHQVLLKECAESKERLEQIKRTLNTLTKVDISSLPPQRAKQISELRTAQFPLMGRVQRMEKELKQMEEEMENMKRGEVRIGDIAYPGVVVTINKKLKKLHSEVRHSALAVHDEEVRIGPY